MKRISLSLVLCAGLVFTGCKDDKKEKEMDDQNETEMSSEMDSQKNEEKKKAGEGRTAKGAHAQAQHTCASPSRRCCTAAAATGEGTTAKLLLPTPETALCNEGRGGRRAEGRQRREEGK